MKTTHIFISIGSILSLILAGCNMATAGGPGPRTWIDAPLNGSTLPLAPVVVRSHASSNSGTQSATLYVNGVQVRVDNISDPSAQLVEISQAWEPTSPGSYEIKVVTLDSSGNQGNSNNIHVNIGEVANPVPVEGGQQPETLEPPETSAPAPVTTEPPPTEPPPSIPMFTFTTNANCREGPSTQYDVDDSFMEGQGAQIDGRSQYVPLWWWVLRSNGGHCWVSDSTGNASGPTETVQVVPAPPPPVVVVTPDTPTSPPPPPPPPPPPQTPPSAPYKLHVQNHVCAGSTYTVTLAWGDTSNNETGFRVYRGATLITTLGANATSYTDSPPTGGPYYYMVEAFNNAGATQSGSAKDDGCIF